jgi:hypothetical protein
VILSWHRNPACPAPVSHTILQANKANGSARHQSRPVVLRFQAAISCQGQASKGADLTAFSAWTVSQMRMPAARRANAKGAETFATGSSTSSRAQAWRTRV